MSVVGTAAAGERVTRWVDDPGAGGGPSECATAVYTSIQDAIDDSSAGDRVRVCPGNYLDEIHLNKRVQVRSVPLWGARIVAPAAVAPGTDGITALVRITANNARLRGFRLEVPAGEQILTPFGVPPCTAFDVAVFVLADNVGVRNNNIYATGDATNSGNCGYDYGIVFGSHGNSVEGGLATPVSASGRATFNWVTNFKRGGILIEEEDTDVLVRRNTVRYLHEDDPGCEIFSLVCEINLANPTGNVNEAFRQTFGIGVESSARADVSYNAVYSGPNSIGQISGGPGGTALLSQGIALTRLDELEQTVVFHNFVHHTSEGIVTDTAGDGAVISYNVTRENGIGIMLRGGNDEIHNNRSTANQAYGIYAGSENNDIHDNNATGNGSLDCADTTSGSGTAGTANTWTSNLGDDDSPDGICAPSGT
jgi:hypothetical protein